MVHAETYMISENWHIIIARNDHESTTNIRLFAIMKDIQKTLIMLFKSILKLQKLYF